MFSSKQKTLARFQEYSQDALETLKMFEIGLVWVWDEEKDLGKCLGCIEC